MIFYCNKALSKPIKNAKLLAFASLLWVAGTGYAQNQVIKLPKRQLSRQEVFRQIEKQTDLSIDYNNSKVGGLIKVKINVAGGNIRQVLKEALKNTGLGFRFEGKHILIYPQSKTTPATGNKHTFTGRITDANGEPIIGGTIQVKGTTIRTVTDFDGNFTLEAPEGSLLAISYIGFKPQEVRASGTSPLQVKMREDTEALDEVIVIGYGTTSTKKIVSSVTAVKGETLQNLPYSTVTGALQGRATGVIVQQSGGEPGSTPKISIRGGGDPIYVIDGVISNSWDFNMLNADDIESMSILKDAASLAVYGSRAANGIVMVKTKQGRKGKTSITYSFNAQFNQPTMLPDKIDSYSYALLQNEAAVNDGYGEYYVYDQNELNTIKNQTDPYTYANTDWVGLGLKNFAPEYKHSLSMTGNSNNVNYYVSLGMFNQGSIYTSNALNYDRYTLRSNVNTRFEEIGLNLSFNVNGAVEKKDYPSFSANTIWDHLFSRNPLYSPYNEDGTFRAQTDHPLVEMDGQSGYDRQTGKFINVQMVADWELPWVKGLTVGTMVNYRNNDSHNKKMSAVAPQFYADGSPYQTTKPTLTESANFGEAYNFELNASYVNTFLNKHSIDAKVVFTVSESTGFNFWASRKNYMSTSVDQLFAGDAEGQLNSGGEEEGGRMGIVGRLKYDYANRYYIEGSCRYDGSDNFAPGHRWGFFPSVAAAWDITEEPFFKSWNLKDINRLKLRGSYGVIGTEAGVNRFAYLSTYSLNENALVVGGKLQSGFSEGKLTAPAEISWYTRRTWDFGLDYAFLNNRLKGSIDYFYYITKGGLMSPASRYTTPLGKDLPQIKSDSESRREGVEMAIRWNDKVGSDFTYDVGFNMVAYRSMWAKNAGESISTLMNPRKRDTQQNNYYTVGYIAEGLYQTEEQLATHPRRSQATNLKLGDIMYKDVNNDGIINDEDKVRIGSSSSPRFTYGIDFSLGYKGLQLSGLLYGTGKRNLEMGTHYKKGEAGYTFDKAQYDYWTENNRNARFPRIASSGNLNGQNNQQTSTYWLVDASFLRLRNLSLSYDLKYSLLKKAKWMSTCRVNLTGANLFTISDTMDYFDPETASTAGNYPVMRTYTFGLTIGF